MSRQERKRVQIDFDSYGVQQLANLESATDVRTRQAVFNNALRVYEWLVEKAATEKGVYLDNTDLRMMVGLRPERKDRS